MWECLCESLVSWWLCISIDQQIKGSESTGESERGYREFLWPVLQVHALLLQIKRDLSFSSFAPHKLTSETRSSNTVAHTAKVWEEKRTSTMALVEDIQVTSILDTEASLGPEDWADSAGSNSIYTAILSRNEAVKDAKRLKTFLELRDKYVRKKVLFEDPLFPADDSTLFYSRKCPMKFEWKRPSVSECLWGSRTLSLES